MDKPVTWPRLATALCAYGILAGANTASAQDSAAASAGTLEEVVVTAQRQEENLQKTPIAVTSITSDTFDKLGNGNVSNLVMVAPSLQVGGGGAGLLIGIRGIITANGTDVGDPAVAFETDGLYHARSGTQGSTLFDVDRIEVLRGPQGTLYGRNATTGVVNVISKRPTSTFGAEGWLEAGSFGTLSGFGAINVPISDAIAVRGAFTTLNHDPFFNNGLGKSQDYGDLHETAGRITATFKATEDLSILLRGSYDQVTGNGPPANVSIPLSSDPFKFPALGAGAVNSKQWLAQAQVDWTLPFATLTYEGGYHTSRGFAKIASGFPTILANPTTSETQQHELRIANSSDRLKYVAGLFYFRESQGWFIYVDPFVRFLMPDEGQHSKAIFGQATFSVTDSLRLTAGLRYTKDDKHRTGGNYTFLPQPGNPASTPVLTLANFADISSSKLNYKAGVDYDLNPTSMLYGSVSTGYKQGGFFDGDQNVFDNTYKPENVRSIEIGTKNRFLDNRLQVNAALFQYKYTDFQVSFQDAILVTRTYNAQEAKNTGLELEVEAAPTEHDRIGLSATYLHARYETFNIPGGPDVYGKSSYSGNRLPFAPDYGVNVQYDHTFTLPNDRALTFGFLTHWQSETDLEFHGFVNTKQKAYARSDINITWGDLDGHYSVTAFVRNLEDKHVLTSAALPNNTTNTAAAATGALAAPRTFGIRMNLRMQ